MEKLREKYFYKDLFINLLIVFFLSHIFYKISFIDRIFDEFLLISQLNLGNIESSQFFVESPIFTMLGFILKINDFDVYLLFVYIISILFLLIIVLNIKFLGKYSSLFLLSGWLVTTSWFMGHVDILSVLLIVLITKNQQENEENKIGLLILYLLLTINHNALAFVCFFIFLVLIKNSKKISFAIYSFIGQVIGNALISFYLNIFNFSGRGRLRFVFNENVILDSVNFVSNNIIALLWSGFLGFSFIIFLFSSTSSWTVNRNIFSSLIIALFFTSIALDTSRIFSLSVIPITLFTIKALKESEFIEKNLPYIYILSFLSTLAIGPYHIYGNVHKISPHQTIESFYNFIPRIVNSLMSNVWN